MDFYQILSVLACLILMMISLCFVSSTFKFYLKNILLLFWHGFIAVFVAIASLPNPGDQSNMRFWRIIVDFFHTHWLFGIDINVENGRVLETDKACVVVSNHQDTMDIAASVAFWPPRCTIVAKKSLQYAFTFGIASTLAGAVFVNRRRDPEEARKNIARCVKLLKYHDVKIWMYPEGTRSGNNQIDMLPFKKGAFRMAIQAQTYSPMDGHLIIISPRLPLANNRHQLRVPIVPVVFSYYKHQYNSQLRIFNKVKITARVMDPLPTKGMTEDDIDSLLDTCRDRMLKTFYEISTYLPPTNKEKVEQNQNELTRSDEMLDSATAEDDDRRNFCESG